MELREKLQLKIKKYYKQDQYIHYSNCHEDVDMIFRYGNKNPKRILSICSALDNSLALLLMNPEKITVIDTNVTQIYLAKLKMTAIRNLSYEEYLEFYGFKDGDSLGIYRRIEGLLDEDVRQYFNDNIFLISEIKLINCGKFEHYFQILKNKVMPSIHTKKSIEKFMQFDDLESQFEYYNKHFKNHRFKFMFKVFFSSTVMSRLGRDKAYFKFNEGSLTEHLKRRTDLGFMNNKNKKNPYMQYVLLNRFDELPMYVQEDNFNIIKTRLDRINIINESFDEAIENDEKFDLMNLSDIFEYMPNNVMPDYEEKIFKSLNNGGRVIYWNMLNDRFMGNKLKRIETSIANDRCFYYKNFLTYEK